MSNCCENSPDIKESALVICKSCSRTGSSVNKITLESLLNDDSKHKLIIDQYYFCKNPLCSVVYFANPDSYFYKKDLIVEVSLKESRENIPVCYCFGYTKNDIKTEIQTTGKSTIEAKIKDKVQAGLCSCEIKNPQGKCCLYNIRKAIDYF